VWAGDAVSSFFASLTPLTPQPTKQPPANRPTDHPPPQVLHYLETLAPAPLFDQLVAVAVSEAAALLGACQAASLPAVARVVSHFREAAAAALRRGGGGVAHALTSADGDGLLAGDYEGQGVGFSDMELELLLAEFQYLEQVVVTAESLLRRLPDQTELCARAMACLIDGAPPVDVSSSGGGGGGVTGGGGAASSRLRSASGARRRGAAAGSSGGGGGGGGGAAGGGGGSSSIALAGVAFMPVAEAGPSERAAIAGWLAQAAGTARHGGAGGLYRSGSLAEDAGRGAAATAAGGPGPDGGAARRELDIGDPAYREWVILCSPPAGLPSGGGASLLRGRSGAGRRGGGGAMVAGAAAAGGGAGGAAVAQPPSRMYVQEADAEMRLAFALVSQPGV
jgi:hypothetical protein